MEPQITYINEESKAARKIAASELRDYLFMTKLVKAKQRVDRLYKAGQVLTKPAQIARAYHEQTMEELADVLLKEAA